MKRNTDIQLIIESVKKTANKLVKRIFDLNDEIKGKEETITGNIQAELSSHFVRELESDLSKRNWEKIDLKVETFTKDNENKTGADLSIILKVSRNNQLLEKGILVQSKVGKINNKGNFYATNDDILTQADDMLKFTSDSFFFIYTKNGIKVFSALAVKFNNKNAINSDELYYHDFDSFIAEFFKCFIGDHKIKSIFKNPNYLIKDYIDEQLNNLIKIEITFNEKEQKKKERVKKTNDKRKNKVNSNNTSP